MSKKLYLLLISLALSSCIFDEGPAQFPVGSIEGFKPLYAESEEFLEVRFIENVALTNPGKIYIYNRYLLVSEPLKGVHIYDNIDPTDPKHLGFIRIAGNEDIALKGNILYADQIDDVLAIDLSNVREPVIVDRQEDVYNKGVAVPPGQSVYFECVDNARKNLVVGWEWTTLENPECFK